jgi:hypothetical protein
MRYTPSRREFVILEASHRQGLSAIAAVETDGTIVRLSADGAPHDGWMQLRAALGETSHVQPVLLDDAGGRHLPTGDVTVRFKHEPAAAELDDFARRHALALVRRNEFEPGQVVFHPTDAPNVFLPHLVEALERDPATHRAWANTRTRYQRGQEQ